MKKVQLSPVTSLLTIISLVLGILVSDLAGARLLTRAHAQTGSCTGQGSTTVVSGQVEITQGGTSVEGITLNGVLVGDNIIPNAAVSGSVQISSSSIVSDEGVTVSGVLVGDNVSASGVLVGDNRPCPNGVLVGDNLTISGVLVGDNVSASGVLVGDNITATGGVLVGDNVTIQNGVVSGQNLRLVGATITGTSASVGGIITAISIDPTN